MTKRNASAVLAGLLSLALLAVAQPAAFAQPVQPAHPERDTMGSTISAHEPAQHSAQHSARQRSGGLEGIDVSHWQGAVTWSAVAGAKKFAYTKATEGTDYLDPKFWTNFGASFNAGMLRGAYHFALPNASSGAAQARYFVNNGGGWVRDDKSLPPMLDIEYNPYGATCYGLSPAAMSNWIADFSNELNKLDGRLPMIYSTANWWNQCTGNSTKLGANPLFVARYASSVGSLPSGWKNYTFWQYSDAGSVPGISGKVDLDTFDGSPAELKTLANNDQNHQ